MVLKDYVCVDLETTGVNTKWSKIIEIGAVKVRNGAVVDTFSQLINPGEAVTPFITELTGITDEMLQGKPTIEQVLPEFIEFAMDDVLLGHNLMFDFGFLKQNAANLKLAFDKKGIDTLKIARKALPNLHSRGLEYLCTHYGILDENHHRALNDAQVTSQLYLIFTEQFAQDFPLSFEPKELNYRVRKMTPITERQKSYLKALIEYHQIEIDYDISQLTKNEASKKIDKILSEKGRIFY
ncbi:MAG: 3'-5' exoribonuclease [Eubacterium sp.]|nr:3'-5' exoribonuclease [Eubacterium sp.]